VQRTAIVISIALATVCAPDGARSPASARTKPPPFRVTSPAFPAGGTIPDGFTCDGAGASPPIVWRNVPAGTEEVALVVDDPDAPGATFVHWVLWGIDPDAGRLPEELLPAGVLQGRASTGQVGYVAPCPPSGDGAHRYRFTAYALAAPPAIGDGATATDLRRAIRGTVLARSRVIGRYER
jgi:Raf kinase inhibitor-like YbhB/YbcL family protein